MYDKAGVLIGRLFTLVEIDGGMIVKFSKRILGVALVCIFLFSELPLPVYAREQEEATNGTLVKQTVAVGDADELLSGYFQSKLYEMEGVAAYSSNYNGAKLTGANKVVYDKAKELVERVAAGTASSTEITVPISEVGMERTFWSAADLGVPSVWSNGVIPADAERALQNKLNFDGTLVVNALLKDCPYEMFWFGNTYHYSYPTVGHTQISGADYVYLYNLYLGFEVSADYAATEEFTTDAAKIATVTTAVNNAKQIAANASSLPDMQKLDYYAKKLCDLNSYNYEAASPSYTGGYGNPWQIIYMFDGDPNTKVVCEGYAKAFQYLCDLSRFTGNIYCYTVTGTMFYSSGSGLHMWNIIHMDDNKQYLVDITNCDVDNVLSESSSFDNSLFIAAPDSGSVQTGYAFGTSSYQYDRDTTNLYSAGELTLSATSYQPNTTQPPAPQQPQSPPPVTHTHTWDGGRVTKEATPTSTGTRIYTCTGCGATKEETIGYVAGSYGTNNWANINGKWFYFDDRGQMAFGWQYINGKWYYLGSANDGSMKSGWQYIGGCWYYLGDANDGSMKSDWQYIGGCWYYLGGANDGSMKSGWQYIGGYWYYLGGANDGSMKFGWQYLGGKWYYLGGANDGSMKSGWQYINGYWYYLGAANDGAMAANTWIGRYYVDASGSWTATR